MIRGTVLKVKNVDVSGAVGSQSPDVGPLNEDVIPATYFSLRSATAMTFPGG